MKVRDIAEYLGCELIGEGDAEIFSVADISTAKAGQLAFYEKDGPLPETTASCVVVGPGSAASTGLPVIVALNPKLAFARIAALLHPSEHREPEIHSSSVISPSAKLGDDVFIGAFVCIGNGSDIGANTQLHAGARIGDRVTVGSHCVIHPNVSIEDGCTIGDNVVLHSGVVIGADGFGYVKDSSGKYHKFPQIGSVVIENDVEIGANTCVDRGALGETRIGEGTKIDNLVQVGHNVSIGKHCVIAAQTGISGSVVIEDDCVIGGQVGFGDHIRVRSGAVIGSQAGILPGKIVRPGVWWGTPIQPLEEYKRQNAHVKGIERLKAEVKALKEQIRELLQKE